MLTQQAVKLKSVVNSVEVALPLLNSLPKIIIAFTLAFDFFLKTKKSCG
jgi:hypothetical protein